MAKCSFFAHNKIGAQAVTLDAPMSWMMRQFSMEIKREKGQCRNQGR
jgi:hypothetical protein